MLKKTLVFQILLPLFVFAQLGEFSLIAPSNYSEDVDVWPLFQWQTSENATNYFLQISTTPQFYEDTYVSYECGNVTKYRPPIDLIMGRQAYYWRVLASDSTDSLYNDSSQYPHNYWTLQTIPETEPREILGSAPLAFNRTLITENSPYTMRQGNLVIPVDKYLKVREGIIIQIEGDYYMEVNGLLQMNGTSDNYITVTTTNSSPNAGSWGNIRFNSGSVEAKFDEYWNYISGPIFQYVNFEYGGSEQNIIYSPNTALFVDHCHFENSYRAGVFAGGGSLITNNEIYANDNSNACIYISETMKSIVKDNSIDKGKQGIYVIADSSEVSNNTISNCKGTVDGVGIYFTGNQGKILNNEISNCTTGRNGGGIYAKANNIEIKLNKISTCNVTKYGGGVYLDGNDISFHDNEIMDCYASYSSSSSSIVSYGGGVYIAGNNEEIINNTIENCYVFAKSTYMWNYRYAYAYGGGLYLNINDSNIKDNEILNNYSKAYKYYYSSSYSYGGGIFLTGNSNRLNKNIFSGNYIFNDGGAGPHRYGAGLYIQGSGNAISSNNFLNNDTQYDRGGGIFVNEDGLAIDSCTFSSNKSKHGAGIYVNKPNVRIDHCTITKNEATEEGAGIYGGKAIYNSTIKYNKVSNFNNAGGIYGDPDTVYYCNINHNDGYNLKKSNSNNTEAIYNWWFTRSDEITIESSIYDADDTAGSLGFATYQPFLTDVSPTTPGNFKQVTLIEAKDDATYNTTLNHVIGVGDTMYVQIEGIDSNQYNKDVTVLKVYNKQNWSTIRPFFEETEENSGVFHCKFYLADYFKLPATIQAKAGDTLIVSADVDPSFFFEYVVPEISVLTVKTTPIPFNVILDSVAYETPFDIKFEKNSTHEISVEECQPSDQPKMRYEFDSWSDSGAITHTINVNSDSIELIANYNLEKYQSDITINTYPAGYSIFVDSLEFTSPKTFLWEIGSEHQISVRQRYDITSNSRNIFKSWGGIQDTLFTLKVGSKDTTYTAAYGKQYLLNINAGAYDTLFTGQLEVHGAGWYFENDSAEVWIEPDTLKAMDGGNEKYQYFTGWTPVISDYPADANRVKIKIIEPIELTATWSEVLITDIHVLDDIIPSIFRVSQNYPNPFNPMTTIDYDLPKSTRIKIELFNILGQRIAILLDENKPAGRFKLLLDGQNLPSATYILRVKTEKNTVLKKIILLK